MKELTEMAAKYAAEKTNELLTNTIAKAYADGYRDGYNDREGEISVELDDDSETEYVDLGLPSGTLWSADYETEDDKVIFLPYQKAERMQLPTEKLWKELLETCKWRLDCNKTGYTFYGFTCIGPNGNSIYFSARGYKEDDSSDSWYSQCVRFWISDCDDGFERNAVCMDMKEILKTSKEIRKIFSGYKLPIRLVRAKQIKSE